MTIRTRNLLRLFLMFLLIVSAGTAGFLWGQNSGSLYLAAGVTTLIAMLAALSVEHVAANAETQFAVMVALLRTAAADDLISDEKARRLDLIVGMLEEQNEKFRMNLLTNKVHEMDVDRRAASETVPIPLTKAPG